MKHISKRAKKATAAPMRMDMEISLDAQQNQYDAQSNPDGTFPLNIAENRLQWPILKEKFKEICASKELPPWVMGYTSPLGDIHFRQSVARFYERYFSKGPIDPDLMGMSPGATGIIEMTAFILCDKGDVCAMPTPAYPVYRKDLGNISGVKRYDIKTHKTIADLQKGLLLSVAHLEKAKKKIKKSGDKLRMVVLTTPDNPTGLSYNKVQLLAISHWCMDNKVHLVVNEIYALSAIDTTHPTIQDDYTDRYVQPSFLDIMAVYKSDYLHHWYSVSKDFGISGFRTGIVYSYNKSFIDAYENLNLTHTISNHTQWLLGEMLDDHSFIDNYIAQNKRLLTKSYTTVVNTLKQLDIPYAPARGGLFNWIDLSKYLARQTKEAEEHFWLQLYQHTGVLLTPGDGFGHNRFGYFRLVFPYVTHNQLLIAMERMTLFLSREEFIS